MSSAVSGVRMSIVMYFSEVSTKGCISRAVARDKNIKAAEAFIVSTMLSGF